jgi:hypothetical protein
MIRIALAITTAALAACTVGNDGSIGESAGKFTPATEAQADTAKATVIATLKDPDSARFGPITTDGKVICGTVNAKNAFGGYVGPKVFAVDGGIVHMHGSSAAWSFYGCPGTWGL